MAGFYKSPSTPKGAMGTGNESNSFGGAKSENVNQAGRFGSLVKGFNKPAGNIKGYAPASAHKGLVDQRPATKVKAHNATGHSTNLKPFSPSNKGQAGKIGNLIGFGKKALKN